MSSGALRTIAIAVVVFLNAAFAVAGERQHRPGSRHDASRDPYADPAAPYKADRLASPHAQPILNLPGQTTVLTREVLDDMKATSLRDAMRSTAGVTVGR
jgi:outer membrane receptor for monomeric catechols